MERFFALKSDADDKSSSYVHLYNASIVPRRSAFIQVVMGVSTTVALNLRWMTHPILKKAAAAACVIHYVD